MNKYLAEFIGTFALTNAVLITLNGSWSAYTPLIAGLTVGLFVYTLGAISGAHFNPAITIGAWSVKKIPTKTALLYILVQFAAALIAHFIISSIYTVPTLTVTNTVNVFMSEMMSTALLAFGIAAVVFGRVTQSASGLTIGGSLALAGIVASVMSNGVLNPAVALGIGSFSWLYALAPIVGSVVAFQVYRQLQK